MSANVISIRGDVTLAVVLRWLRRHQSLPPHTDTLMVLSDEGRYQGKLAMSDVVVGDPDLLVTDVMKPEAETVRANATDHEVATMFERRDLISVRSAYSMKLTACLGASRSTTSSISSAQSLIADCCKAPVSKKRKTCSPRSFPAPGAAAYGWEST